MSSNLFHLYHNKIIPVIGSPNTQTIKYGIPNPKAHFAWDDYQQTSIISLSSLLSFSILQQLNKLKTIEEVVGYINKRIVTTETHIPLLKSIKLQNTSLEVVQYIEIIPMRRKGIKQEAAALNIKSEDPKKFSQVSFKKQSNEITISVLYPTVFKGSKASRTQSGYDKLKVRVEVMTWK